MSDPLSIAGSAVGVISLGIQVAQGLVEYYSAIKNQDADMVAVDSQLRRLKENFTSIDSAIKKTNNVFPNHVIVRAIEDSLLECQKEVEALRKELNKIRVTPKNSAAKISKMERMKGSVRRFLKRAEYPFRQKTLEQVRDLAQQLNGHLATVMSALGM